MNDSNFREGQHPTSSVYLFAAAAAQSPPPLPFQLVATRNIINASCVLIHHGGYAPSSTPGGSSSSSGGSSSSSQGGGGDILALSGFATLRASGYCDYFAVGFQITSEVDSCLTYFTSNVGVGGGAEGQEGYPQQVQRLQPPQLQRRTDYLAAAAAVPYFPGFLTSGSVVRIGEGMVLLSTLAATSEGNNDPNGPTPTYLIENPFTSDVAVPLRNADVRIFNRSYGTLIRVRGLNSTAAMAPNPVVRYFLLGGSSDVVEELIGNDAAPGDAGDAAWQVSAAWQQRLTVPHTNGCVTHHTTVVYPSLFLPFAVMGCSATFSIITFDSVNGPKSAFSGPNEAAPGIIAAIVVRESYVLMVTTYILTLVVAQFGSDTTGSTSGQPSPLDANAAMIGYVYSATATDHTILDNCGASSRNAAAAFVDPDTNNFVTGCGNNERVVFAIPELLPARVLYAGIVYPNPNRTNANPAVTPPVHVKVIYKGFNDTALLMFSEYDDCSVFLTDGPFSLSSGSSAEKIVTLHHAAPGMNLFLCASLGYCPLEQPSGVTCDEASAPQDCMASNGCMYSTTAEQLTSTCCPRQPFPNTTTTGSSGRGSGYPPSGAYWMLVKATPLRVFTATAIPSSSATSTESFSDTVTGTSTITATVTVTPATPTLSNTIASRTRTASLSVSAATLTGSRTATQPSPTEAVSESCTHPRNTSTHTLSSSVSITSSVTRSGGSVTVTHTVTASPSSSRSHGTPTATNSSYRPSRTATPSWSGSTMSKRTNTSSLPDQEPPSDVPKWEVALIAGGAALVVFVAAMLVVWVVRRRRLNDTNDLARGFTRPAITSGSLNPEGGGGDLRDPHLQGGEYTPREIDSIPQPPTSARVTNETTPITSSDNNNQLLGSRTYNTLINSNKYTISKLLGKGGYGMVFLATRNSDQKKAALKYITCKTDYDRQLAVREFEVIVKVKHPNMIPIWDVFLNWQSHVDFTAYGAGTTSSSKKGGRFLGGSSNKQSEEMVSGAAIPGFHGDQAPFQQGDSATTALTRPRYVAIVTKYYPDGDLKRYCYVEKKQGRQLSEERVLSYLLQITTLIVKLHDEDQQIVHRDLKPENILLEDEYRRAVVTDFGLAFNNVNEATHMTTQAGSLPFVAPECWSKYYNAKVDVWSLGCMLYALCTQRVTGDDSRVMFNDVDEPWFEEELRREVVLQGQYSVELFQIMMQMLVKNPLKRLSAYQAELELAKLMRARRYDMSYVTLTPEKRPERAVEREREEEKKRTEADARAAEEAATRKAQREKRKLERQQMRDNNTTAAAAAPPASQRQR